MSKGNPRSSGYTRQEYEWYIEPRRAVDELLEVEVFPGTIWDPCCGSGNIPRACKDRGLKACGTDIVDRGWKPTIVKDFFEFDTGFTDHIICNPPFSVADLVTLHGLKLVKGKVAILQRTCWLEGEARYGRLFRLGHLARVWQFRTRISMPPGAKPEVEAKHGFIAYAWFIFESTHNGLWTGGWLP